MALDRASPIGQPRPSLTASNPPSDPPPQRTAESALLWIHVPQGERSSGVVRRRRCIANRKGAPSFVARGDEGIVEGRCGREARVSRGGTGECSVRGFIGGSVRFVTSGMGRERVRGKVRGKSTGTGSGWGGEERDGDEGGSGQRPELALVPERDGGVAACRIEPGEMASLFCLPHVSLLISTIPVPAQDISRPTGHVIDSLLTVPQLLSVLRSINTTRTALAQDRLRTRAPFRPAADFAEGQALALRRVLYYMGAPFSTFSTS